MTADYSGIWIPSPHQLKKKKVVKVGPSDNLLDLRMGVMFALKRNGYKCIFLRCIIGVANDYKDHDKKLE